MTSLSLASTRTVRWTGADPSRWLIEAREGRRRGAVLHAGHAGGRGGGEAQPCASVSSAHEDLFSCCQRRNFKGAPYSFFAIHVTAALVLFVTDGMTVSLPSGREGTSPGPSTREQEVARAGEGQGGFLETSPGFSRSETSNKSSGATVSRIAHSPLVGTMVFCPRQWFPCW